jgi:2,3-bisphosphoglycerate-independent phosphoglycerate mutase
VQINPNDQYLPSFTIVDGDNKPVGTIEDGDAVVLFNFRADRMVELSKAFEYTEAGKFTAFDRERVPKTKFVGMMQYDGDLHLPKNYLVPPPTIEKVSAEWLAKNGMRTFACSETQKFGHVTFFWNGNRSGYFDEKLETYVEIPSDNVPFNTTPAMKAPEITAAGIEALRSKRYDVRSSRCVVASSHVMLLTRCCLHAGCARELRQPGHGGPHRRPGGDQEGVRGG